MFAKAEFTNLNSTKKIQILFVKSDVEIDLRKRNRFSTKYLTGRKKTWVGIICGVVPQNLKILWNSWPLFCGSPQCSLVRRIFCGIGFVNSAFASTLICSFSQSTLYLSVLSETKIWSTFLWVLSGFNGSTKRTSNKKLNSAPRLRPQLLFYTIILYWCEWIRSDEAIIKSSVQGHIIL